MKIAPTPWGRDKYGSIIDATGERVELTGIAMATGRISDDAPCHANSALLLAAPKLLEVVQALLLTQQMRIDPREVLDENSPIMDAARDALRMTMLEPVAVGAG